MKLLVPITFIVILASPAGGSAQQAENAPPRCLDAEVAYLTFSWAVRSTPSVSIGPEFGVGFLKQLIAAPSGDDATGVAHVGVRSTFHLNDQVDTEIGLRVGLAELRSVACSGCFFSGYTALGFGLFGGNRTLRFGTRLMIGGIEGEMLAAWSPLILRVQF